MKHCEYIEAMRKVYSAPPPQSETSCDGYRNKYTGTPSHVCKKCACSRRIGKMYEEVIEQQRETIRILQQLLQKAAAPRDDGYDHNITFGQCAEEYKNYIKRHSKPSSIYNVTWQIDHMGVLSNFGECKVDDMKRSEIQKWVDELAERYAPKTVRDAGSLINTILKYAAKADLIPAKSFSIDYPKENEQQEYRVLTKKEFNKLRVMLIDDESAASTGILVMLETGCA